MEAYVERMIEEQKNLQEKIDKLEKFINSDDCKKLSVQKQFLLELQHAYMVSYNSVLVKRIEIDKQGD